MTGWKRKTGKHGKAWILVYFLEKAWDHRCWYPWSQVVSPVPSVQLAPIDCRTLKKQANTPICTCPFDKIDEQILTAENQMASYLTSRRSELVEIKEIRLTGSICIPSWIKKWRTVFRQTAGSRPALYNSAGQRMVSFRKLEYSLLEDAEIEPEYHIRRRVFSNDWVARKISDKVYCQDYAHIDMPSWRCIWMEILLKVIEKGKTILLLLFLYGWKQKGHKWWKLSNESAEQQIKDFGQELIYNDPRSSDCNRQCFHSDRARLINGLRYKSFLRKI